MIVLLMLHKNEVFLYFSKMPIYNGFINGGNNETCFCKRNA